MDLRLQYEYFETHHQWYFYPYIDTLLNFNYDKNTNENDLALYTSIQLCMKIKNRLQSDRELEELQTHIACKISMDGLKSIQNACEMNYVMLHNKINKNKIQNKKTLTRVHFTKEIEKFASTV